MFCLIFASRASAEDAPAPEEEAVLRPEPQRLSGAVSVGAREEQRVLVPPFVRQRQGDVTRTALFPFYFERKSSEGVQRFVLPYYYRREKQLKADVALGLVWSLRGPDRNTFVLPPLYTHRRGKNYAFGLPPLFATGRIDGHYHTVIPPLLSWFDGNDKEHHWVVGPLYDIQSKRGRSRGIFPVLWSRKNESEGYAVVPPIFWRFTESESDAATTVVPPFYYTREKEQRKWGLFPVLFHKRSPELKATTVPLAAFHHARGPNEFRLVTPVLAYLNDKSGGSLLITPIYQRRRGDRSFDAVLPLFMRSSDTRDASRGLFVPPIYFHREDPANRTTVIFPLLATRTRDGISDFWMTPLVARHKQVEKQADTYWVAPTFHYRKTPDSWNFNIHPLFYTGRSPNKRHLALAPLFFDFANRKEKTKSLVVAPFYWYFADEKEQKKSRSVFPLYWDIERGKTQRRHVIGFPLYWDFDYGDRESRYTVAFPFYARSKVKDRTRHFALNTMYETSSGKEGRWQFHLFPLFSRGGSSKDRWWNILYGLAGYDRRGRHRRVQAFWIPFQLD